MSDERVVEPHELPRHGVMLDAVDITQVNSDRNKNYGTPTQNFEDLAVLMNMLFRDKLAKPLDASDAAHAMIALKFVRLPGNPVRDNYVDLVGYAGIAWETQETREKEESNERDLG